jgi:hypothetical protein
MTKHRKKIDLSKKSIPKARKNMKRLVLKRNSKFPSLGFKFLLPSYKPIVGQRFIPSQIMSSCPYCSSALIQTEAGIVCSGKNLKKIAADIYNTVRRWGPKTELFLSRKANNFFDIWLLLGKDLTCDYITGIDENKWRINNRLLSKGVDRKMIFSSKKR